MRNRAKDSKSFRGPEKKRCSKKLIVILLIVIISLTVLAVGLGVGIPAYLHRRKMKLEQKVNKILPILNENMDLSANPCSDFYQYVCGKFINNSQNLEKFDMNIKIQEEIFENCIKILDEPKKDDDLYFYKIAKDFYQSCIDEDTRERLHTKPLTDLLDDLGGWPVLIGSSWKPKVNDWMKLLQMVTEKHIDLDFFTDLSAFPSLDDSTSYIITLRPPTRLGLPIPIYQYNVTEYLVKYKKVMETILIYLGGNNDDKTQAELEEIVQLETKLANLIKPQPNDAPLYSEMSISQLDLKIPGIDWNVYIGSILPFLAVVRSDKIQVKNLEYLRAFKDLIWNVDNRVVTNYVLWRIISVNFQYLNKDAVNISSIMQSVKQEKTKQKTCADNSAYFLYLAVNAMYVRKFMNARIKSSAINLVEKIKTEFDRDVDELSWMDSETKKEAKIKLAKVRYFIAYPEEFFNDDLINSYYGNIKIDKNTYFQNVMNIKWFERLQISRLLKDPKSIQWTRATSVISPKASYSIKNELTITLHFLQKIYFNSDGLTSYNFGGLGTVIGHEFFHAIDLKGGQFNENGIEELWWSNETSKEFTKKQNCFIDQYSNYTIESIGKNVNGVKTVAENMADNMGVYIGYQAFRRWFGENKDERDLQKIKFTPQQIFWIAYATKYCAKSTPKIDSLALQTDIHSPDKFRVIGPIQNHPQFLEDFKCDQKSEKTNNVCLVT